MANRKRIGRQAVRAKSEKAWPGQFTQWLMPEDERYHPISCCDCGLVHIFQFGRLSDGRLAYRAKRAVALTKERRRHMQRKRSEGRD